MKHASLPAGSASASRWAVAFVAAFAACSAAWADANITVYIRPVDITGGDNPAQFMVSPSNTWQNDGYTMLNLLAGIHTIAFKPYPSYYTPASFSATVDVTHLFFTNTYRPWTNQFSVTLKDDLGSAMPTAGWWLSQKPDTFTNYTSGTGELAAVVCPTGSYTIVYGKVAGYNTPVQFSTNVAGVFPAAFTGLYGRLTGSININLDPTNGIWEFVQFPNDITNFTSDALSGTGLAVITNAPSGPYEIQYTSLAGYETPRNVVTNISTFPYTFQGTYGQGVSVRVHVYQPGELIDGGATYCSGVGTGRYEVSGSVGWFDGVDRWMFASNSLVTFTAFPSNMVIGDVTNNSFFYEWGGYTNSTANPLSVRVTRDTELTLLFSREYYEFDNVGDLDQDGLPDEWERKWGLDPKSSSGINGTYGNPSGDYIPSSSTNPPMLFTMNTNFASSYMGTNSTVPGYPLRGAALERGYNNASADTGVRFHNWLQCRGLDGFYMTNGPAGGVADDDPRTDPMVADTSEDGLPDGWSYYFWYWRSADAYGAGLTNSANLSWVRISPCMARMPGGTDGSADTDEDGLTDLEEYQYAGTDPTHADTDADGMDDKWEYDLVTGLNPLLVSDGSLNQDEDWYAVDSATGILTNGTPGTAFAENVYHNGSLRGAVWVDVDPASGAGVFDLYRDTVLLASTNAVLTNRMANGVMIVDPVLYGTQAGLPFYTPGYPVWVDADGSGTYSDGDTAICNPFLKNSAMYMAAPGEPGPGVTMFNSLLGWFSVSLEVTTNVAGTVTTNTDVSTINQPYSSYQEYHGGDYIGRVSWNAGGRVFVENDDEYEPTLNSWTDPGHKDTDNDGMPDGWELYVGLNPQDLNDANEDSDGDGLSNLEEWSNATDDLTSCADTWANKLVPTDPGALTAADPNDPHPMDTDWDGVADGGERDSQTNPSSWDTDGDNLPDGWEAYAGTDPIVSDAMDDTDGDGLLNHQEYWTGTVPEWMMCDSAWNPTFLTRRPMSWDAAGTNAFIPPDIFTCPSFRFGNNINADLADLRANFPASSALGSGEYRTTLANEPDTDMDGMDDYWEVYHALNPLRGVRCRMLPSGDLIKRDRENYIMPSVASADARPDLPGFQFGIQGQAFSSMSEFINHIDPTDVASGILTMVGPFNFGLEGMDPDGDGLPNTEEYSYSENRAFYHTDPSPLWRTCQFSQESFVNNHYGFDRLGAGWFWEIGWAEWPPSYPFAFEMADGFDTDGDLVGDYYEINRSAGETGGTDPLDPRNPLRNRALFLNGTNDFARTIYMWTRYSEIYLARFCIEAWVQPTSAGITNANAVIIERAGLFANPYDLSSNMIRANFRLGVTNGIPFVMYNGRGAGTTYQSIAQVAHKLQPGVWAHLAGAYDGTNLTIYVNGEASASIKTTELPATGYNVVEANSTMQALMIGARDLTAGVGGAWARNITTADHFEGYIDEIRIWDGGRTLAEILEYKDTRILTRDLTNSAFVKLEAYYSFDDVPDPDVEGIVPEGIATLDTSLSFHPALSWWRDHPNHSTVYTGSSANAYNWIMTAQDHMNHKPLIPPMDDILHVITNAPSGETSENYAAMPEGYRNPSNPYHAQSVNRDNFIIDLYLFGGAKGTAAASWLASLDPADPDSSDSDGDGLPDWWESLHGLDPMDASGINGPWGDPDYDGLNNWAEYQAGTDPWSSDTDGDGVSDYDSNAGPGTRTWGEMYSDGDGMPDEWEMTNGLDPHSYDANLDYDGDGWSNYQEYQAGTNPADASSHPNPALSGTVCYNGTNTGPLVILAYQTNTMDGIPRSVYSGSITNFSITNCVEGDVYLFGFLDLNGDGTWSSGEPCGVANDQPISLSASDADGVILGISDTIYGYGRFAWSDSSSTGSVNVTINRITQSDAPQMLARNVRAPRSYFHEWDYQLAGIYGLSAGSYEWWVGAQNGTFSINWSGTQSKPELVYPRGDTFIYARNMIGWTMDKETTAYHLQIFNSSLQAVVNYYFVAPYPDKNGVYWDYLPYDANELGNDTYYWRIAGYNPACESEWSELQSFRINLSADTSRSISGGIYYFGKAGATSIVVQAFDNSSFSGTPDAQVKYYPACTEDNFKIAFTIKGLLDKAYYVKAFIDTAPAGGSGPSGVEEFWSSSGFVRSDEDSYKPKALDLTGVSAIVETTIAIRDKDTDNDNLPDAWEMMYFGNMNQTGDMDYDGDGDSNLTEYSIERLDTDPSKWDSDADGLSDRFERLYGGSAEDDYNPYSPLSNPSGNDLNPIKRDTDEDGYSDGSELKRYGTNPLDPSSSPAYAPECYGSRPAPADYDGDGRSDIAIYDETSGAWHLLTWYGQYLQLQFGNSATKPLSGDFDGDGASDFAVYEPNSGYWYVFTSAYQFMMLPFGNSSTIPVPGDYDGDWKTDFGVYDPATGYWYVYTWNGEFTILQFGNASTIPVPGDYDADGRTDFAIYEPATGVWYVFTWDMTFYMLQFGNETCIPVPGDYDGDDKNDFAVFDPATGYWYILSWTGAFYYGQFGWSEAVPMAGDFAGDGRSDLALYCTITGNWYIYCWSGGNLYSVQFGWPGATPVLKTK